MAETQNAYVYEYPRPMVVVDCVVFGAPAAGGLEALLIQRLNDPHRGQWALPGGFVDMDEPLDAAARRELEEETGLAGVRLEQFYAFGQPDRDPRGRNIAIGFVGLVDPAHYAPRPGDDAGDAHWVPLSELPELAFDHEFIIGVALSRMRLALRCFGVGRQCFQGPFTMEQLRHVYESVLEGPLSSQKFARVVGSMDLLEAVGEGDKGTLYRFSEAWPSDLML